MFSIWQVFEEVPATSKKQLFGNLTTAKVDFFFSIKDFFSISRIHCYMGKTGENNIKEDAKTKR